jgi:sporulation protein YlmC with PRC-barrel domain
MYRKAMKYWAIAAMGISPVAWCQTAQPDMNSKSSMNAPHERPMLERAYQMLGMNVYNDQNQKLGDIDDMVLTGGQNRISYAVLSRGGVLGMGDKLFAIPWTSLQQRSLEKDRLFLNIDPDRLAKAPYFDKKNWPDSADTSYWGQVETFYRSDEALPARAQVPAENMAAGAPANMNTPMEKGLPWTRRVSAVIGADVKNPQSESLGDINDLVINAKTGKVQYAVLSFGGWLGIGDKLFAIPIESLQGASGHEYFVLNVSKDRLKTAPGFDKKQWPDFANEGFWNSVNSFYGPIATQSEPVR